MVYCPSCFSEMHVDDEVCAKCGTVRSEYKYKPLTGSQVAHTATVPTAYVESEAGIMSVFDTSMNTMITPSIIKMLYRLAVILSVLAYIGNQFIVDLALLKTLPMPHVLLAIVAVFAVESIALLVQLATIRVLCECVLVTFEINNNLIQIRHKK